MQEELSNTERYRYIIIALDCTSKIENHLNIKIAGEVKICQIEYLKVKCCRL